MAINLSGVSQATTTATALSNLVLVSPQQTIGYQPQNAPSYKKDTGTPSPKLLFNYEGEQTATLTSDITDHFIEDNSYVNDQIAIKPVMVTVNGFVGELNDVATGALAILKTAAEKLTTIGAYTPSLSTTALIAYSEAQLANSLAKNVINSAVGIWSQISGSQDTTGGQGVINGSTTQANLTSQRNKTQTQQQIYFQQFYGYLQNRTLFTIQTPWAVFQDMAIMSVRSVQEEDTRVMSTFEITFKQLRFASTQSITSPPYFQGRLGGSASDYEDQGTKVLTNVNGTPPFLSLTGVA